MDALAAVAASQPGPVLEAPYFGGFRALGGGGGGWVWGSGV